MDFCRHMCTHSLLPVEYWPYMPHNCFTQPIMWLHGWLQNISVLSKLNLECDMWFRVTVRQWVYLNVGRIVQYYSKHRRFLPQDARQSDDYWPHTKIIAVTAIKRSPSVLPISLVTTSIGAAKTLQRFWEHRYSYSAFDFSLWYCFSRQCLSILHSVLIK